MKKVNQPMLDGMAKAFFASAYADLAEENDIVLQGDIMTHLPEKMDEAALQAANTLYTQIEAELNEFGSNLRGGWIHQHGIDKMPDKSAETFGHYAAMQAMGHGVGLYDYCHNTVADLVNYVEFGSHSLIRDYFGESEK